MGEVAFVVAGHPAGCLDVGDLAADQVGEHPHGVVRLVVLLENHSILEVEFVEWLKQILTLSHSFYQSVSYSGVCLIRTLSFTHSVTQLLSRQSLRVVTVFLIFYIGLKLNYIACKEICIK